MPSNRYQTGAYERQASDFYETPRWATELLTSTVRLRGTVWEPCGGKGALAIATNPPYDKFLLPKLVRHWLGILNPVGGQLCLLLRVFWGESKGGQTLTTRHPAYSGKLKTPRRIRWYEGTPMDSGGSAQEEHAWFIWDWRWDSTRMPFDASVGDPRMKGCEVCGAPLQSKRRHAVVCSTSCRVTRHRRRARG